MATSDQRLTEFETAQKRYQDLIGGQGAFKSLVEQKLGEKTNYNKDLINQQQAVQARQTAMPSELRASYLGGPISNPLQQEALIAQRTGNLNSELGSVNALLSARGQDQAKILDIANNNYASQLAAQQNAKDTLYQLYQDALAKENTGGGGGGGYTDYTDYTVTPTDTTTTTTDNGNGLDITVDDNANNWTNMVKPNNASDTSKWLMNNPVATIGTLVGNLIGNKNNKNLTLWQKLLNKR